MSFGRFGLHQVREEPRNQLQVCCPEELCQALDNAVGLVRSGQVRPLAVEVKMYLPEKPRPDKHIKEWLKTNTVGQASGYLMRETKARASGYLNVSIPDQWDAGLAHEQIRNPRGIVPREDQLHAVAGKRATAAVHDRNGSVGMDPRPACVDDHLGPSPVKNADLVA